MGWGDDGVGVERGAPRRRDCGKGEGPSRISVRPGAGFAGGSKRPASSVSLLSASVMPLAVECPDGLHAAFSSASACAHSTPCVGCAVGANTTRATARIFQRSQDGDHPSRCLAKIFPSVMIASPITRHDDERLFSFFCSPPSPVATEMYCGRPRQVSGVFIPLLLF